MPIEIRYTVMSPETGIEIVPLGPPLGISPPPGGGLPENKIATRPIETSPSRPAPTFAKRLDTLENKTIYLVDLGFGGSFKFMIQLQKWFKENIPSVTTIRKRKGDTFFEGKDDLWEEVKANGHAVIVGVAG